jgi:YVTN family beta-propeller protein
MAGRTSAGGDELLLVRRVLVLVALVLVATSQTSAQAAATGPRLDRPYVSPAGDLAAGPRPNGTAVLPDGRLVTPVGDVRTVDLLPLNLVPSHDGGRLYVTSEGGDDQPDHDHVSNRFVTVMDAGSMATRRVQDDALQYGLAESPDGREVYVSEGESGTVGVFRTDATGMAKVATVGLDKQDFPWGLAMAPDGRHAYVVGFRGDSLSVIDTASRTRVDRVATGQFPYTVAVSPDGTRAYVSNWGLFNPSADHVASHVTAADTPPVGIGGYNTDQSSSVWFYDLHDPAHPKVTAKVRIGRPLDGYDVVSGSLPSSLAVSPDGRTLAVTASNDDSVVLLDAATGATRATFDLRVFGAGGPTGAQPDAVAWSPDGHVLYVAEGGRNSVAALDATTGRALVRFPTGWYPSAVALSPDGSHLYVASAKGRGAGPNGVNIERPDQQVGNNPSYIGNLLKGTVQSIDLRDVCGTNLQAMDAAVDHDNGVPAAPASVDPAVVPSTYGAGPSARIKHVVFILKENRTYDQVFGDLAGTERDDRLGLFTLPVTPNHHAAATQFGHGDNYYDIGQDSFDGHFIIDSGSENEFDQKVHPTVWNADKLGPEGLYVSAPENLPLNGYMWNNLYRHDVSFRIYGEATYLLGLGPTALVPPSRFSASPKQLLPAAYALNGNYSLTYPSQITPSRPVGGDGNTDEDRAADFLRELSALDAAGTVPQFLFLWMTDDHTEGATPGRPTPQYEVARNDHALGRILEGLTHSKAWGDMAVFVTEDDPQDGQDHLDAHRTIQLVLSPYAKRGYVSHVHHSNLSTLKTIDLLLGVPPNSTQEATATPLTDYFRATPQLEPRYSAKPQQVPYAVNPSASTASNASLAGAARLQAQVPPGLDQGGQELQQVLDLQQQGAAAAGQPGTPVLRDEVEHHVDTGAPKPVRLAPRPGGPCPLAPGVHAASAAGAVELPVTGGRPQLVLGLALLLLAAVLRPRQARD